MPTTDAYGQGIQIAALTDAPDAAQLAQDLADGLVPRSVMRFSTASVRNATISSPVAGMLAWLDTPGILTIYKAGGWQEVDTDRTVVETTSGATPGAGWSLIEFQAARTGGIASWSIRLERTGPPINATPDGNVTDFVIGTVPSGWRPRYTWQTSAGAVSGGGEAVVGVAGDVTIRSWSSGASITTGEQVRISATYVL